jgi:hypothetical protein
LIEMCQEQELVSVGEDGEPYYYHTGESLLEE